jgi:hypothetical protein
VNRHSAIREVIHKITSKGEIESSLISWLESVSKKEEHWQELDIHIDEVVWPKKIKRNEWLNHSIDAFNFILKQKHLLNEQIPFLHIFLSIKRINDIPTIITMKWIEENMDNSSPPHFMCTDSEYFKEYYSKLQIIEFDENILKLIGTSHKFKFFFNYFIDTNDGLFIRSLYVFEEL